MNWKTEAVTRGCQETAEALRSFPWLKEFYLAGGTALALRYGHRISVDLDFFSSSNDLRFTGRERLLEGFQAIGALVEEQKDGTVHARYQKTHISFFRYRYPLLRPLTLWNGIHVAGPLDIGLMKIGAIMGRGSRKDFVDLYFILKEASTLPQLLRLAHKKFSTGEQWVLLACRALVYFEDADREPPLKMTSNVSWPEVKRFFETEVRKRVQRLR